MRVATRQYSPAGRHFSVSWNLFAPLARGLTRALQNPRPPCDRDWRPSNQHCTPTLRFVLTGEQNRDEQPESGSWRGKCVEDEKQPGRLEVLPRCDTRDVPNFVLTASGSPRVSRTQMTCSSWVLQGRPSRAVLWDRRDRVERRTSIAPRRFTTDSFPDTSLARVDLKTADVQQILAQPSGGAGQFAEDEEETTQATDERDRRRVRTELPGGLARRPTDKVRAHKQKKA